MKKNIYTTILVILTICCIIGGTIYHVFGWLSHSSLMPWNWGSSYEKLDGNRETYESQLDAFSTVKIDGSVFDITIESGDGYYISYDCVSYLVPEIRQSSSDKTLEIIQPRVPHFNVGIHNNNCEMTLIVPSDCKLEHVTILGDVGDINMKDISGANLSIESAVGDAKITHCNFDFSDVSMDVGELEAENSFLGICTADSDVGDMTFSSCDYTSLDAGADVGDIEIELQKDISHYEVDLSCDIGSVSVNGKDCRKSFYQSSEHNSNSIIATTSTGDIKLKY